MSRPEPNSLFDAAFSRLKDALGVTTQADLGRLLGVQRHAVSDAKKRDTIPGTWLTKLADEYGLRPQWILKGDEPRYIEGWHKRCVSPQMFSPLVSKPTLRSFSPDWLEQALGDGIESITGKRPLVQVGDFAYESGGFAFQCRVLPGKLSYDSAVEEEKAEKIVLQERKNIITVQKNLE